MTTTQTTSIILDPDAYVEHGIQNGTDCREWADTFTALGGTSAGITPGWQNGTGHMLAHITGTPEAIAYVENNL